MHQVLQTKSWFCTLLEYVQLDIKICATLQDKIQAVLARIEFTSLTHRHIYDSKQRTCINIRTSSVSFGMDLTAMDGLTGHSQHVRLPLIHAIVQVVGIASTSNDLHHCKAQQ